MYAIKKFNNTVVRPNFTPCPYRTEPNCTVPLRFSCVPFQALSFSRFRFLFQKILIIPYSKFIRFPLKSLFSRTIKIKENCFGMNLQSAILTVLNWTVVRTVHHFTKCANLKVHFPSVIRFIWNKMDNGLYFCTVRFVVKIENEKVFVFIRYGWRFFTVTVFTVFYRWLERFCSLLKKAMENGVILLWYGSRFWIKKRKIFTPVTVEIAL
jgi:hypothetical protein